MQNIISQPRHANLKLPLIWVIIVFMTLIISTEPGYAQTQRVELPKPNEGLNHTLIFVLVYPKGEKIFQPVQGLLIFKTLAISTLTSNDEEKIKEASTSFLRRIADDPNPILTNKQISVLSVKIDQFKDSKALADNIKNAKKNESKIVAMAKSRNLKPQFLLTAALAKLGNRTGDVVATARKMLEQLATISKQFGNDTADENLLIIAAYSNNTSAKWLQNTAGTFSKHFTDSAQTIRSIWFFRDHGKLTDAQFDFALRFLAIGTITQNPKDFYVTAEAIIF